jgi:hypothetical protein
MKIQLTALALVTLATLGTACDSELGSSSDELSLRGDVLDPRPPTTGGIVIKGGHDNPWEILTAGYDKAPSEYQLAFEKDCEKQIYAALEDEFLSDEHVVEICSETCEKLGSHWEGGVGISELRYEHGEVRTMMGEHEQLEWQTEARVEAQVGCGCG